VNRSRSTSLESPSLLGLTNGDFVIEVKSETIRFIVVDFINCASSYDYKETFNSVWKQVKDARIAETVE